MACPRLHILWLDRKFSLNFLLFLLGGKFVEYLPFLDLSVFQEHVKGRLAKWNDVFKNVPKDTLGEWCSRKRTSVGPSSVELKQFDELGEV